MKMIKKKKYKIIKVIISIVIIFSIIAMIGITIAHAIVFSRADYDGYDSDCFLLYSDINEEQYPRKSVEIQSGNNTLTGYLYGADNSKGVVVVSTGHRDPNDVKLYEIEYFVNAGWKVLCYDYTGCYNSEGSNMRGYTQSVHDLDSVLNYVESDDDLNSYPVVLFGHSLGAYASAAVLKYNHSSVKSAIIASGFDTPKEQWTYSIKRYTSVFHYVLVPYTKTFISLKYGEEKDLSAIDGINSVNIPILIISGTDDIFYGDESPIYKKKDKITNNNCTYLLMDKQNHNGHYDYFLTDEAIEYQNKMKNDSGEIDKNLYMQHDSLFMDKLDEYITEATYKK